MRNLMITFCVLILFIGCSSNKIVDNTSDELLKEFYSLPYQSIQELKNDNCFFIFNDNNKDGIFTYPNIENTFFLFHFKSGTISVQGFNSYEELEKLETSMEFFPELNNENFKKYSNEKILPFTMENGQIVKSETANVSKYYFNDFGVTFYKEIKSFDLLSYDKMKNINADENLKSSLIEFDSTVRLLVLSYLFKLNKIE